MAQADADELQADFLTLRELGLDVKVRLSGPLTIPQNQSARSLLAVSNAHGLLAAVTASGFTVASLAELRAFFASSKRSTKPRFESALCSFDLAAVPGLDGESSEISFLRVSDGDGRLLVGLSTGSIAVWELSALAKGGQPAPARVIPLPSPDQELIDLIPNPGTTPHLCAVLLAPSQSSSRHIVRAGSLHLLDTSTGTYEKQIHDGCTSVCWSAKGKRIALGLQSGEVKQLTPDGEVKDTLAAPPQLEGTYYPSDILWVENEALVVTYSIASDADEPEHQDELFVILRDLKAAPPTATYLKLPIDPAPPFGDVSRSGRRFTAWLRGWAPMKHIVFSASVPSTDVGALGCSTSDAAASNGWAFLELAETSRPVLPFSSVDDASETSPFGLALDLTAVDEVDDPAASAKGEEGAKLPAAPILYIYTNDGVLLGYHVINTADGAGRYTGMVGAPSATSAPSEPLPKDSVPPVTQVQEPSKADTGKEADGDMSLTEMGEPATTPAPEPAKAAAAPAAPATTSAFGFGAFATPSSASGSGTANAFAAPKPSTGFSFGGSFGSSSTSTSTPAFGQSSPFGTKPASGAPAASTGPSGSAFGQSSAFGQPSAFGTKSAFGTAAGSTGQAATPLTPAFGQTSAFGAKSAFGAATSSAPAFGQTSAFGAKSTFGTPTSGSEASKTESTTPAGANLSNAFAASKPFSFGAGSTTTSTPAFGASTAFGAKSPFGSASQISAPSTSTQASDGAATTSSASNSKPFGFSAFGSGGTSAFGGAQPSNGFSFGTGGAAEKSTTPIFGASTSKPPTAASSAPRKDAEVRATSPASAPSEGDMNDSDSEGGTEGSQEPKPKSALSLGGLDEALGGLGSSAGAGAGVNAFSAPKSSAAPAVSAFGAPSASVAPSAASPAATPTKPVFGASSALGAASKPASPFAAFAKPTLSTSDSGSGDAGASKSAFSFGGAFGQSSAGSGPTVSAFGAAKSTGAFSWGTGAGAPAKSTTPVFGAFAKETPAPTSTAAKDDASVESAEEKDDEGKDAHQKAGEAEAKKPDSGSTFSFGLFGQAINETNEGQDTGATKTLPSPDSSEPAVGVKTANGDAKEVSRDGEKRAAEAVSSELSCKAGPELIASLSTGQKSADTKEETDSKKDTGAAAQKEAPLKATSLQSAFTAAKTTGGFSFGGFGKSSSPAPTFGATSTSAFGSPKPAEPTAAKKDTVTTATSSVPASVTSAEAPKPGPAAPSTASFGGFSKPSAVASKPQEAAPETASAFGQPSAFGAKPGPSPFSFGPATQNIKESGQQAQSTAQALSTSAASLALKPSSPFGSPAPSVYQPGKPITSLPFIPPTSSASKPGFSFAKPQETGAKPATGASPLPGSPALSTTASPRPPPTAQALATLGGPAPPSFPAGKTPGLAKPSPSALAQPGKPSFGVAAGNAPSPATTPGQPESARATGIAGEAERVYLIMEDELEALHKEADACDELLQETRTPRRLANRAEDFDDHRKWSLGDLPLLLRMATDLRKNAESLKASEKNLRVRITGLRDQQLKAEVKREQVSRFIKARSDPQLAERLEVRELGPEHQDNQARLRKGIRSMRERMAELEQTVSQLRVKIAKDKEQKAPMEIPPLDTMHRATRNITRRLAEQIDRLSLLETEVRLVNSELLRSDSSDEEEKEVAAHQIQMVKAPTTDRDPFLPPQANPVALQMRAKQRRIKGIKAIFVDALKEPILNVSAVKPEDGGDLDENEDALQVTLAKGPVEATRNLKPVKRPQALAQGSPPLFAAPSALKAGQPSAFSLPQPFKSPKMTAGVSAPAEATKPAAPSFSFASGTSTATPAAPRFPTFNLQKSLGGFAAPDFSGFASLKEESTFAPGSRDAAAGTSSRGLGKAKAKQRAAVQLPPGPAVGSTRSPGLSPAPSSDSPAFAPVSSFGSASPSPAPSNFFAMPPPKPVGNPAPKTPPLFFGLTPGNTKSSGSGNTGGFSWTSGPVKVEAAERPSLFDFSKPALPRIKKASQEEEEDENRDDNQDESRPDQAQEAAQSRNGSGQAAASGSSGRFNVKQEEVDDDVPHDQEGGHEEEAEEDEEADGRGDDADEVDDADGDADEDEADYDEDDYDEDEDEDWEPDEDDVDEDDEEGLSAVEEEEEEG